MARRPTRSTDKPRRRPARAKSQRKDADPPVLPDDRPVDTKDQDDGRLNDNEALVKQAINRLEVAWTYWRETYNLSKEDVRFMYEDQWPDYAMKGRENRPTLTMNMLPQFAQQTVNNARRAKFSIQVKQIAGKNDLIFDTSGQGNPYSRSQIMEGLIRDIEERSKAHDNYCDALQHTVEGGFSWLFIRPVDNIDDPFDVELRVDRVKHRYSAMIDPYAQRGDKSDAMWCSLARDIDLDEFKERWPDVPAHDLDTGRVGRARQSEGSYFRGSTTTVRVIDYWWKEPMQRTAVEYIREGETTAERLVMWADDHKQIFDELRDEGFVETNRKDVQSYKVKYMRFIYNHVLNGPHDWQSKHLPLVMVQGRELNLDDRDIIIGMFRYAHDPQRMLNFWMSAATEKIALTPRAPWIAAADSIKSHKDQWENMYTQNIPVLLYDALPDVDPPQRVTNITMAQGELQLIGTSRSMLQDTIGVHDANLGRRSNEVSGVALQERQERGDLGTFDFIDNLARAIVRVGEILIDMIPRVYTTDYVRRAILPDDTEIFVDLNREIEDEETGKKIRVFSLDYTRYSCRVDVGPASKTQREEFVKMMIEWGRSDPEGFPMFRDLVVANMDVPQARAIAHRMKMTLPRHMLSPQEQQQIPPPEPTIQDQIAQLEAEAAIATANATIAKAEADIAKAKAGVVSSEHRAQSDIARRDFEVEKGLNREEQDQAGGGESEVSEEKIAAIVKREVAKALASKD